MVLGVRFEQTLKIKIMTRTNLLTKIQFFTMAIIANLAVVLVARGNGNK